MSLVFLFLSLWFPLGAVPTQGSQTNQVISILQQSQTIMGSQPPQDSVATGTIQIIAGSSTDQGTVRILTRNFDQSREDVQTPDGTQEVVFSRNQACEIAGSTRKPLKLELVVTSQSPDFPLALLASALGNPDTNVQYIGLESLNGAAAHHIRFWNTFTSQVDWQPLADFSSRDIWIDSTSGLPLKLSYHRRPASGPVYALPVEVFYSDYRNIGGALYPYSIQKSLNGTPWVTITIQNVALNTGLTDSDFPVQ
jgi:hypothetical protein